MFRRRSQSNMWRVKTTLLIALIPVAFLYARLSSGSMPYFLFWFFALMVTIAFLWLRRMNHSLTVIYETNQRVVERGDVLPVTVRIENESFLPIPWLRLTDHTFETGEPDSVRLAGIYPMAGFRTRVIRYELHARRRGRYRLGPLRVNFGDIFGVFEGLREFWGRRDILVYPRFTPVSFLPLPLRQPFGHVRTRLKAYEDPTELADLRPMRPGDNPKRIHWKTTARLGEPYVKEHELKATADILLVLDLNKHAHVYDGSDSTLEKGVEVAAAVSHYCLTHGYRMRLMAGAQPRHETFRPDPHGFRQVMEVLATVDAGPDPRLVELLSAERARLRPGSTLLIITPDYDSRLLENLLRLQNRGFGVVLFFVHPGGYTGSWPHELRLHISRLGRLREEGVTVFAIERSQELAAIVERRYRSPAAGLRPQLHRVSR